MTPALCSPTETVRPYPRRAIELHPQPTQELIHQGAEEATRRAAAARPWTLPRGGRIESDFDRRSRADRCLHIPGVERAGERTVGRWPKGALDFVRACATVSP